jgi:putative endonuclease
VSRAHLDRGRRGEDLAAAWYHDHGYTVVARNWRCPAGEIDLVARRGRLVVVCEVKARRTATYGTAATAVHADKQRRLRRLAAAWLRATGTHGVDLRFDVVAITGPDVVVIPDAF